MTACPACAAEIADDARFCSSCGRPVAAEGATGAAERRVVTVLFADIMGSTPLGEALDPEDLQDVLGSYAEAMRQEIEAEGGTVEKFIGDAVMAVFGAPVAHEDDPSRALRAALRMRRRLGELNDALDSRHGVRLAMRIGVNTGDVVASREPRAEAGIVTGDAVNAAARLEQTADPDQILVAERTARAARGFAFRDVGALTVRGKSRPVATVELLDETSAAPGDAERGIPGLRAPMVGRDQELELLRSIFGRLASSGRAQLVTIYGDPGIGKSRLTRELLAWADAQADGVTVLKGRCLPYGEAITYWPLGEVLKTYTGVLDSDPPEAALAKIAALEEDVLAAVPDPARSAAVLAFTFGLEDERFGLAVLPPRQVRLETHEAWRAFFTGLAADRPAIVVIEDIHWADDPLLDLLEELADRVAGPLLFVCPSRPDLAQRRTGWGGGKRNFSSIFLEPLSHNDATTLIDVLLAVDDLPDETRESILARADGNPLFLEEIIRHLIDEGRIVRDGGRWRATEDVGEIVIPDTVQAVLAARIDLLPAFERSALLSASVVGRVFWNGSVARLLEDGNGVADEALGRLEDRELVLSQLGSRIAGEREFLFKHVLTRDVAYGTLARRDRARAHADVAAWIESAAGERQREFADLLAHHLGLAYEGSVADPAAPADRREELRLRFLEAALAASTEAQSRMLLDKANAFGEAALDVAADAHERSLALEALGLSALRDYRGDDSWRYLSQAVDERIAGARGSKEGIAMLCARAVESPTRWPASMFSPPGPEEVGPYVEIGLEHAAVEGEARVRLLLARSMWIFAFRREGFDEAEADAARRAGEEAFALAEALGRDDLASAALDGVQSIEFIVGLHGLTWAVVERRLAIVERLTDPWEVGDALQTAADTALAVGRYEDARRWASEGFERARGGPDVWRAGLAWRAIARFKLGDWDGALEDYERMEAARAATRFGTTGYFTLTMWSCIALLHELRGERAAADRLVARVEAEIDGGTPTVRVIPFLARLSAHRGSDDAFERIESSASIVGREMGLGLILEAQCDVTAELGRLELADETVADSRAFAARAQLEALPFYADRLDGRAALARGDVSRALETLARAWDGFGALGAPWEAAVAQVWLGEAQLAAGQAGDARRCATEAFDVFDDLRSVRERELARSLLDRAG
jgi:class 3 adenylate cyclase